MPLLTKILDISICQGNAYEGYETTGTYVDEFVTDLGCDSIRTLKLEVLPAISSEIHSTICAGEVLEGYSSSGRYEDLFAASNGCDSIRTLHLEVAPPIETFEHIQLCIGENYRDFDKEGLYQQSHSTVDGCDSIHLIEISFIKRGDPICAFRYDREAKNIDDTEFITLGPNPTGGLVTIQITKPSRIPSTLHLLSIHDELLLTKDIVMEQSTVDITYYPKGVYIFCLKNGNNVFVKKILKL